MTQTQTIVATNSAALRGDVIRLIRRGWWSVLLAQVFWKIAALLILAPLAVATLNALLGDAASIGNVALARFALSPLGIATILIMPTLVLIGVLLEQSCMVCLMRQATDDDGQRPRISDALALTLIRLPRLARFAAGVVLRALAILIPLLIALAITYWLLLSGADINYYLSTRPPIFVTAIAIAAILVLIAAVPLLWLFTRAFIALPVCLFEEVEGNAALRTVRQLPREQRRAVYVACIAWALVRVIGFALVVLILAGINRFVANRLSDDVRIAMWWIAGLLALNGIALAMVAAVDRGVFAALVMLLHRRFREKESSSPPLHPPPRVRWLARKALVIGLAACLGVAALDTVLLVQRFTERRRVSVTAHRAGAARAPENSLAALRMAIAEGADSAEIDVQRTADGNIVVVHDRDLRRLAGSPLVISDSTLPQLLEPDIGKAVGPQFAGERVATLAEFIEAARGKIRLSVELKYYGRGDPVLAHQVAQTLRSSDFVEHSDVISLDYAGLQQVRELAPEIKLGFLVSASVGDLTRLNVKFLSVSQSNLTADLRKRADARGMSIAVWTVNKREDVIRMIAVGADDIVTDDPAMAVEAVRWYRELSDLELVLLRFRQWLRR